MKITNSEIIKSGERELIDAITGDLNWRVIEKIVEDKHHLSLQDDVEYKKGDMVVFENQIAYKLDFEVKVNLSVLFDRQGNYLQLDTRGAGVAETEESEDWDQNVLELHSDDTAAEDMAADLDVAAAAISREKG
jgi:hypothetical protein